MSKPQGVTCKLVTLGLSVAVCRCGWHRRLREDDEYGTVAAKNMLLDKYIDHRKEKGNWKGGS